MNARVTQRIPVKNRDLLDNSLISDLLWFITGSYKPLTFYFLYI